MTPTPSPSSQRARGGRDFARRRGRAALLATRLHSREGARSATARGIPLHVASGNSTDEAPLGGRQSPFESSTASRSQLPLLFEDDCDAVQPSSLASERLEDVIQERDNLSLALNDIKGRFQKSESELRAAKIEKDALIEKVCALNAELRAARAERDSLQVLFDDRAVSPEKKKRKGQLHCLSSLDVKYVGIASTVLIAIPKMCARETSELDPFHATPKRRWNRRGELVSKEGILMSDKTIIAPFSGQSHISSGKFYTPSFENDTEFLRAAVSNMLVNESWSALFATEQEKRSCMDVLVVHRALRGRLRQSISDAVSSRKRKTRDLIFNCLGYDCLQSRYVSHTEDQKRSRLLQVQEAKKRLLAYAPEGELIFHHWRTAQPKELSMPGGPPQTVDSEEQPIDGNLSLFGSEMAIRAVHEFIGFVPELQPESGTEVTFVEGSILALARLDAYVATVVTCFSDDGTDKAGGHRQKLYHDTFATFLPKAFNQLIGCIRKFVEVWCPDELNVTSLSISDGSSSTTHSRTATTEIYVPSLKRRLLAVSWKWFKEYISAELGAIHDCYIAEFDDTTKQLNLLGSAVGSDTVPGLDYNLAEFENAISPGIPGTSSDAAPDEDAMDR